MGPLVIAGVSVEESKVPKLIELGVKDSKLLAPQKRSKLYGEIKKLADGVVYERIEPAAIDKVVLTGQKLYRLNYLEAKHMARVLLKLKYDAAYIDCCDTNQKRFAHQISEIMAQIKGKTFKLGEKNPYLACLRSEHHADRNYPVVSAASIIAKVTRDASISRLHKAHGKFGSGYPSDPETITFLEKIYRSSRGFPPITRQSWATIRRMRGKFETDSGLRTLNF